MFPPEEEELPAEDTAGLDEKLLADLREWARMSMAEEMRGRHGKTSPLGPPDEGGELDAPPEGELPPEDDVIPGVEAVPGEEAAPDAAGPDMEKVKQALARMKGG